MIAQQTDGVPDEPIKPSTAFSWAALWLLTSVFSVVALVASWSRVLTDDFENRRSQGFIMFTPALAIALTILFIVVGVRAIRRTREFRAAWDEPTRREARQSRLAAQPWVPLVIFGASLGAIWVAGLTALTIFVFPRVDLAGFSVAVVVLLLLAMAWVTPLRAGIAARRARLPR